jgi:hypothetical protein
MVVHLLPCNNMLLGVNIVPQSLDWFGLNKKQSLSDIFTLPIQHVRIGVRMSQVWPKQNTWDFTETDHIINLATQHNKKIHLQLGIKTLAWPEVHTPSWMEEAFSYLAARYARIDAEKRVQDHIFTYIEQVAKRYFSITNIASLHVENEPFSKHLGVTNFRYLSPQFNKEEVILVRKLDPYKRPLVQNIPFDTPQHIPAAIQQSDIAGLNVYPQSGMGTFYKHLFWPLVKSMFVASSLLKKPIWVTEYQAAAWINDNKKPEHSFSLLQAKQGMQKLHSMGPEMLFLWDIEQLLWRQKHYKETAIAELVYNTTHA